jgi:hypothetical protein
MVCAPAPSTCHTGTSYIQCPPTPCFVHRVDAKAPVFRDCKVYTVVYESISTKPILCSAGAQTP